MSKFKLLLYSSFTGLLLAFSWPAIGEVIMFAFIAFFPLLWVEDHLSKRNEASGLAVFFHAYLAFFIFNLLTTWWIYFASDWGAAMAIICNALFMAIVFWLFHQTKKRVGRKEGYIGLILYWIAFEYVHLNWELSWPWLTLGNVFAAKTRWVQWYEYTGILGGSAFIIIANLLFFMGMKDLKEKSNIKFRYIGALAILLFTVLLISFNLTPAEDNDAPTSEVVIIQPNIDPYFDKFGGMADSDQIDLMIKLAREKLTQTTDLMILPETAIPEPAWEHALEYQYANEEFKKLIGEFPNLRIVVGMLSSKLFLDPDSLPITAKKLPGEGYYDNYNAAMQLDRTDRIQIHRKSKLVLGAEKIPFMRQLPFMKRLSVSLGGTTGRYGTQETPTVFFDEKGEKGVAPIICYESVYGEYLNDYKEAEIYAIITNDGWWSDTPGYKQHLAYACLRAIEGRRSIIRSANTGISAIINEKGEIVEQTDWWVPAVISASVKHNSESTFYMKHGDYIGRTASFVAPLLLLLTVVRSLNKTQQRLGLKKQ